MFSRIQISVVDRLISCSVVDRFDFLARSLCGNGDDQSDDETADEARNDLVNACVCDDSRSDRARKEKKPCDISNGTADDSCNCAGIVKALPEQ